MELRNLLNKQTTQLQEFQRKMGRINTLMTRHGTVADAIKKALLGGDTADLTSISEKLDSFQQELDETASKTETSKNTLLQLLKKVRESTTKQCDALNSRVVELESNVLLGPKTTTTGGVNLNLPPGVTADTVFGTGQVGGVDMDLSINSIFGIVRTLEAKVQVLSDQTKNTGIKFGDIAYASEQEFGLDYMTVNPSGAGIAGYVDFASIWNFAGIGEAATSSDWLAQERNAKAVGFSKTIDAKHAYSMSIPYPQALAGQDKNDISVNSTLYILKWVEVWRGGTGDGAKEKLTMAMNGTIQAHKKYCEMELPSGWVREHALKSGTFTQQFWLSLASYIEDEIILLQTFKLPEKSICLLSHQVIQILDDLAEFRTNAKNIGFSSNNARARYAWVSLQALQCMQGYLQAKFRCHQGINATFMRFLTRTMADQSAMDQKQHHVPYSLAILINGIRLLIHGIASTLWAFQYVFLST